MGELIPDRITPLRQKMLWHVATAQALILSGSEEGACTHLREAMAAANEIDRIKYPTLPGVTVADPLAKMNRHERRAAMKRTGHSWASARRLAKQQRAMAQAEGRFAGIAARMSPEEARKALAEWAARGGK